MIFWEMTSILIWMTLLLRNKRKLVRNLVRKTLVGLINKRAIGKNSMMTSMTLIWGMPLVRRRIINMKSQGKPIVKRRHKGMSLMTTTTLVILISEWMMRMTTVEVTQILKQRVVRRKIMKVVIETTVM